MAQYYIVSKDSIDASADAIRSKTGSQSAIEWDGNEGFADAIDAISGGVTPTGTKQISITQNGTTTEDVTNYASAEITVNVSGGATPVYTTISEVTIGANSVTNTSSAKTYFSGYESYLAILLKETPTTNNQLVALFMNAPQNGGAARLRSGTISGTAVGTNYDCVLVEGTHYYVFGI